jgi:phosphotransferase system, enzyme I, PtsP
MALLGIGYRSISMSPAAIGPVKAMIQSLDCARLTERMNEWLATRSGSLRQELHRFAEGDSIEL